MRILYLPNEYSQQRQREKKANIYPVRMAMEAEWYRKQGHEVYWNSDIGECIEQDKIITEPENLPFLTLPRPDRVFTRAKTYTSGNYKYLPGTHIMSASGCWWGKCRFCVETQSKWEVREVDDVIEEIKECKELGFREIFDDSGTFPHGRWLDDFCTKVQGIGVRISANMRPIDLDYVKLRKSGFRMLLFGIESANQETLDRIRKGTRCEDVKYIIKAALSGLEPHGAFIFGYPWESDEDALRTLRLAWTLLRKGYLKTAQASFYTPQAGTPAGQKGEKGQEAHRKYVSQIYRAGYYPDFWFNQLSGVRNIDDLKYIWRGIKAALW